MTVRKCKGCTVMLRFVKTPEGETVPLDLKAPVYHVERDLLGNEVAVLLPDLFHVSHFASCPKADSFSKAKRP